ncbi:MAG TPA: DUF1269 domain-containing protein [Geminicoccaceae bacterium]|nr:DUF1269 domain-containing protein [Geminicoccaceae bacterium]
MADLVAIVYPDPSRAAEVLTALRRLQGRQLLDLEDACVVVRDPETGELRLEQATHLATLGAISGAFWGTLIGLLFLQPVIGAAVGAAAGAITGRLSDYGINDEFMRNVSESLQPGSSAIFMLIRKATREEVEPELARYGGHVLYTNLASEAAARLERLLTAGEPDPAPTRS